MATRIAARKGIRVYEYISEDGTRFWSFTRYMRTTVRNKELHLESRLGTDLTNYLNELRWTGESFTLGDRAERL